MIVHRKQTHTHTKAHCPAHTFTFTAVTAARSGILSVYGGSVEKVVHLGSWSLGGKIGVKMTETCRT